MKNGKYIPLGVYDNVKMGYGTVDFKNLKTIYLKLNSWIQPSNETDDFDRKIISSKKRIKHIIMNLNDDNFKSQSIVDLDIRTNGIKLKKKSFMNLEITLYVNNFLEIKTKKTRELIKNLMKTIVDNGLNDKTLFNFYKTKK
jgi:hypothetical protein